MPASFILIFGKVIDVSFRYYVLREARLLGLKGWVCNAGDKVEIFAQGEENALQQLLRRCRTGPPLAVVEKVEAKEEKEQELEGFEIKY